MSDLLIQLYTVILLNVGGMVQLSEYIDIDAETKVYILDSHRPLNLHNAFGPQNNQVYSS
jgi:cell division control protein 45